MKKIIGADDLKRGIKPDKDTLIEIHCYKCGHVWLFSKGIPRYRVHCPKCQSTANDVNEVLFGGLRLYALKRIKNKEKREVSDK